VRITTRQLTKCNWNWGLASKNKSQLPTCHYYFSFSTILNHSPSPISSCFLNMLASVWKNLSTPLPGEMSLFHKMSSFCRFHCSFSNFLLLCSCACFHCFLPFSVGMLCLLASTGDFIVATTAIITGDGLMRSLGGGTSEALPIREE
jgi:hypothetical protein